jgi:intermediate filament protein if
MSATQLSSQSFESEYHSSIAPRESTLSRSSLRGPGIVGGATGGRVLKIVTEMGASSVSGINPEMTANAAKSVMDAREREKKDMQELNERLGNYIDRVRFLEAQNRKLVADLDELRGRWGKDTAGIKATYDAELSQSRRLMDETAKRRAELDVEIARLTDEVGEMRLKMEHAADMRNADKEHIATYTNMLGDYTSEIEMLRRRLEGLDNELARQKADNQRYENDLGEVRSDLDKESVARIDFQNQAQTLLEEIEFLRRIHDQEVKELEALMAKDTPASNKDYFRNELALAIGDIRNEYDAIAQQGKSDMESWYKMKVQEVSSANKAEGVAAKFQRDETQRLRGQLNDSRGKLGDLENQNMMLEKQLQELTHQLEDDQRQYESAINDRDTQIRRMREEVQALMMELQSLMDTKQSLDAEIAIYRRMLESEESRAGLKGLVEQVVKSHSIQQQEDTDSTRSIRGELSSKTSYQRSAKGNVTIADVNSDGKFIVLENTHRTKDESMDGWKLKRKIDGKKEYVFVFPTPFHLRAGRSVKIWAKGAGGSYSPPESLIFGDSNTWGTGKSIQTTLYNQDSEERATHVQRVIESQN